MNITQFAASFFFTIITGTLCLAAPTSQFSGKELLTNKPIQVTANGKKGLVVIFLSAKCPCSNSHIDELKALSQKFAQFQFVAVHSNIDEKAEMAVPYFKAIALPFPLIQDEKTTIADQFKALKTPHAFVVASDGTLAYQGGVSDSNSFARSEHQLLREALEDLAAGRKVRTPEGRTLGCAIARESNNAW